MEGGQLQQVRLPSPQVGEKLTWHRDDHLQHEASAGLQVRGGVGEDRQLVVVRGDAGLAARSWIGAIGRILDGGETRRVSNTCATQGRQRRSRWSWHCGGGSVKPSAEPAS